MPRTNECDFCGGDIEPGTGTMFVHTDGSTVHFCSSKCEKNADLGRRARDLEWTEEGEETAAAAGESEESPDREADIEDQGQDIDAAAGTPDVEESEEVEAAEEAATEPGPEGEGAEEAAADGDAEPAEAVEDDGEADDQEEEEAEA